MSMITCFVEKERKYHYFLVEKKKKTQKNHLPGATGLPGESKSMKYNEEKNIFQWQKEKCSISLLIHAFTVLFIHSYNKEICRLTELTIWRLVLSFIASIFAISYIIDNRGHQEIIFLISSRKLMVWVPIRNASVRLL